MLHICSWSGGKDSTASIILAHEHGEPLDMIIFSEVMFDKYTSGELPEHIEFVHRAKAVFEDWGYPVHILRSDKTYLDLFFQKFQRSKTPGRNGMYYGFPLVGKCVVNSQCKMKPIRQFLKSVQDEYTQYVGIALEEKNRLERIINTKNTISLLAKYGYTEKMAYDLCKKYNLISPIYEFTRRGGCWFCPNAKKLELRHLRENHRELWDELLLLENEPNKISDIWNGLTNTRIHDWEEIFQKEIMLDIF